MSEISDEFKIVVIDAVRALCLKFPQKYATLMKFLSTVLREEGGLEYKRAIVQTMLSLMASIEEVCGAMSGAMSGGLGLGDV
jgi:coatomer protein complex subunit gamma